MENIPVNGSTASSQLLLSVIFTFGIESKAVSELLAVFELDVFAY
jgi:hypothetical protein